MEASFHPSRSACLPRPFRAAAGVSDGASRAIDAAVFGNRRTQTRLVDLVGERRGVAKKVIGFLVVRLNEDGSRGLERARTGEIPI
jgi:hypothetical protein